MKQRSSFRRIYGPAVFLGILTIGGLLSALFGDGIWNVLSWIALAIPLIVIVWWVFLSKMSGRYERQT